ncbi:MAG: hypothetical protein LBD06_04475 [Candidatus Accumulibacter sp.]|nr:hypothetical protein [Accumulibacter sp.]
MWLAAQPQSDPLCMLPGLLARIEALGLLDVPPHERLKTLEVLRKTVFAVGAACQRQCEDDPLPLGTGKQATLSMTRRLWRGYALGYRQCLQACLDDAASLSREAAARAAHRTAICLRAEQLVGYAGGFAPALGFWKSFHALFSAAERLGCLTETQEDRLFGETRTSSVFGQYAMALMLHLARPFSLSSGQLAAVTRWLARWRERVQIDEQAPEARHDPIPLDLAADRPVREGEGKARQPRWLSLGSVQRKIRQRLDALAAGESPESLRLGDKLSAENCMTLLNRLADNLRRPPQALPADAENLPSLSVGAGLAFIHCLLGGKGFENALRAASAGDDDLFTRNRQAVYGHVAPEAPHAEAEPEHWRLARRESDELVLLRLPGEGKSRLVLHGLLAVGQQEERKDYLLAVITALWQNDDGILFCSADPLPGRVTPRVAEIRNWVTGEVARHPAFQLGAAGDRAQDVMLLPAGVLVRASGIRFFDDGGELQFELRVSDCLERGDEVEFWRVPSND